MRGWIALGASGGWLRHHRQPPPSHHSLEPEPLKKKLEYQTRRSFMVGIAYSKPRSSLVTLGTVPCQRANPNTNVSFLFFWVLFRAALLVVALRLSYSHADDLSREPVPVAGTRQSATNLFYKRVYCTCYHRFFFSMGPLPFPLSQYFLSPSQPQPPSFLVGTFPKGFFSEEPHHPRIEFRLNSHCR